VFGSVAQLLYSLNEDQYAYEHKCDLIQYKMDFLRVPEALQNRVLAYYENMWQYHKSLGDGGCSTEVMKRTHALANT